MSAPTVLLIYRRDKLDDPKKLRAMIVSRGPSDHENDSNM